MFENLDYGAECQCHMPCTSKDENKKAICSLQSTADHDLPALIKRSDENSKYIAVAFTVFKFINFVADFKCGKNEISSAKIIEY